MIIAVMKQFKKLQETKRNEAWTGFEPITFVLPVRCSIKWAMKPSTLEDDQFVGFICPCGNEHGIRASMEHFKYT